MRVLVTGSTGFVGSALVQRLVADGAVGEVVVASRQSLSGYGAGICPAQVADFSSSLEWDRALDGVSTVFHLAARVHVMHDTASDPLEAFRRVNVAGTLALADSAVRAGVKRLVFVSSIKVNGETTEGRAPFAATDTPAPSDPYGISKLEAEEGLRQLAAQSGLEVAIVRPPLVYGPGVKANFRKMLGWLQRGVPLPFGAIDNRRSLVALDNLVDLIATCGHHPGAADQTFLASDGEDLSTTQLLRRLGQAMGKPARLIPVPAPVLQGAFGLFGKRDLAVRLCASLAIDSAGTRSRLGWIPPVSVTQGLARTAEAFLLETSSARATKSGIHKTIRP